MQWDGKVVLITGASRGLGLALARTLAARGATVAMVARGEAVEREAAALASTGARVAAFRADVGSVAEVDRLVAEVADALGAPDVLIHAAGTLGPVPLPLLLDVPADALEEALRTNVVGPFHLARRVAGPMVLRGEGLVVAVSSDAAVARYPRWGVYASGKAAFDLLIGTLREELADTGVRFASVDPGEMDTAMHAAAAPDADRASLRRPEVVAEALADVIARGDLPARSVVEV